MINWFKRSHDSSSVEADPSQNDTDSLSPPPEEVTAQEQEQEPIKEGIFARFRKGLSKTRLQLGDGIGRLLLGKKKSVRICLMNWKRCSLVLI